MNLYSEYMHLLLNHEFTLKIMILNIPLLLGDYKVTSKNGEYLFNGMNLQIVEILPI